MSLRDLRVLELQERGVPSLTQLCKQEAQMLGEGFKGLANVGLLLMIVSIEKV